MSSHFDCIGLQSPDEKSFTRILELILDKAADDTPGRKPYRHIRWTDTSGASVAFHLRDLRGCSTIECVTPFFEPPCGLSRWHVKTSFPTEDPKCQHCGGIDCNILDENNETITRSAVQLLNFLPYKELFKNPQEFELEVVAFAHQAAFYANKAEFDKGQRRWWSSPGEAEPKMPDGRPMRFADNVFLPEGMFANAEASMNERAIALFAGRVEYSQRLTNTITGAEFQHIRIETLQGALDIVLDPKASEGEPSCGKIAFIRAWLVGRPTISPPETKRGWWKGNFMM